MKRHKILLSGILSAVSSNLLWAQNRFPKPDFESGYEYPEIHYAMQNESFWVTIDIFLLILLMSIVAWAALKRRTRKPILWVSVISVLYFGFYRTGCVCSIGSIQNVSLALADNTYILPVSVLLFFILPVLFALLFGRVFCAGVCPFGALQELVIIKNFRLSKVVTTILSIIPWLVLIFAVLYAVTRSSFIICRFEPFIGIFRLGGDIGLILFGTILLILSIFIGRPFCRFLCPYGALLSLFSAVSVWKIKLTSKACINCELCHNACPVDAIRSPYGNKVKESRQQGVKRLIAYFIMLYVIIAAVAFLFNYLSEDFIKLNKEVKLYDMIQQQENNLQALLPLGR